MVTMYTYVHLFIYFSTFLLFSYVCIVIVVCIGCVSVLLLLYVYSMYTLHIQMKIINWFVFISTLSKGLYEFLLYYTYVYGRLCLSQYTVLVVNTYVCVHTCICTYLSACHTYICTYVQYVFILHSMFHPLLCASAWIW